MLDTDQGTNGTVLLVEDNRVNQLVARVMLENLGYAVDIVADGVDAVAAASRTAYRAILMDCQIPLLDGYAAAAEIRRVEAEARHTPIIAVTATATSANRQRCRTAGMDDCLAKPLDLSELGAALIRAAAGNRLMFHSETTRASIAPAPIHLEPMAEITRPVLDPEVIASLEHLGESAGEDLMGQLATMFLANAESRLDELRAALAIPDAVAVTMAAHTLRGASANIGATNLARRCAWMETHGIAGDLLRGAALLEAIEAELRWVRTALEPWAHAPIEAS